MKGAVLAAVIFIATAAFVAMGTLHPIASADYFARGRTLLRPSSTPEAAVENLGSQIRLEQWQKAYSSLANKAEFTQDEFFHDLAGSYPSLRTYATVNSVEAHPLHATASTAEVQLILHWSSVVGGFVDTRDLHLVKDGDRWAVDWPLVKRQHVPPQVIPVNYLRWDVIYRGPGDDWGAQDVEAPHVRIVDMHPEKRAEGVFVLGELLNEDVVPAFVSVRATLLGKNGAAIGSEGSFDMISHTLLPKEVTPFLIRFPDADLSKVTSIRMDPLSILVSASADPVIEIQNQKYNPAPEASLTGQLVNESGQTVNIAHVLTAFYDKTGQVIWVGSQYIDRALLPQTPVPFDIPVPEDLAKSVSGEHTITATYSLGGSL